MEGAYKRSKGNAGLEGVQFQLDLLIVFLSNALRYHKGWKISSENQEAGKYDDLVIELTDRSVYVQSKFKQTRKITRGQLFSSNSKTADFSLPKYFFSYLKIKSEPRDKIVIICTNTDVNPKGLENILVRHNAARDSLLHCEGATCSFFTLSENVLPDLKTSAEIYFDENLQGKGMDKAVITDENMKEFLKNFQFFYNYPSGDELHKIIEQLLSRLGDLWCKTPYHDIYRKVEDWFKQPKGEYLTEFRSKAMLCEIRSDKYCESLKDVNVTFDRNYINITESQRIIHVKVKEEHLLQILKIYYALEGDNSRKLYVNPEDTVELQKNAVEAFSLRRYTILIIAWSAILDETVKKEIINKLRRILEKDQHKKVVLVTDSNADLFQQFELEDICQIEGSVTFQDLSKESQERPLKTKNVLFQGQRITLGELLHTEAAADYTKSLNSAMLGKLVRGNEIKVGVQPSDLDDDTARYYVSRRFQKNIDAASGVRQILTEEDLCGVKEKIIVVSDSAGMGKSTVLTKMAVTIKKTNPSVWVIKINLNDYTRVLRDFLKAGRSEITAGELLNSQEATKITNEFEKFVFSMRANIVLMLDGVDEISPDYTDLVLNLLTHCQMAANFLKIFVTTRPHVDLKLKDVGLIHMIPFTRLEQADFLTGYWMHNLHLSQENETKCKLYVEELIYKLSSWTSSYYFQQHPFTDIPLQVRMLAEIFQENIKDQDSADWEGCKEYLERGETDPKLPEKFNIAELYDTFIEKKRDVFIDKGSSSGNVTATPALLNQFESCLAHHRILAVSTILPEYQQLFKSQHLEGSDTNEYILKIGIVQRLEGRIEFIHRTFAEYFLANCIVQELKLPNPDTKFQQLLIDMILWHDEFKIVRTFLEIFLQRVSLPPKIFKQYRKSEYKESNPSLIFELAREGHVSILRLILESVRFRVVQERSVGLNDCRPRLSFQKTNTLNDLEVLVRKAGVNIKREDGKFPLHLAVNEGSFEMVNFLVQHGANVNVRDHRGEAVVHIAASRGAPDIVACLVKQGLDMNVKNKDNYTALHLAMYARNWGIVKYLVEHGANVNARDGDGITALHAAARFDREDIIKYLLKHGADINMKCRKNNTVLHVAIDNGSCTAARYAIKYGADFNTENDDYLTAWHMAARFGKTKIVQYLVKHGANINMKNSKDNTALHMATYNKNLNVIKYLIEHGADVNAGDAEGLTALHEAAKSNRTDIVEYLLEHGADGKAKNSNYHSAQYYATPGNRSKIVEYFAKHGSAEQSLP